MPQKKSMFFFGFFFSEIFVQKHVLILPSLFAEDRTKGKSRNCLFIGLRCRYKLGLLIGFDWLGQNLQI